MTDLETLKAKMVSHICKVCKEPTLCDETFIKRHLRTHQLYINQYVEEFKLSSRKIPQEAKFTENDIGNYCVYKCNICGDEFNVNESLTKHQLKLHKQKTKSRSKESLVKIVYDRCKLCEKSILFEKANLKQHCKKRHGLSLEEYCKLSGCNLGEDKSCRFPIKLLKTYKLSDTMKNLCEFTCRSCNKTFHCSRAFLSHVKNHHQGITYRMVSSITKGFSYKCKLCQGLMLCDLFIIHQHMNNVHAIKQKNKYEELYQSFSNATPTASKIWRKVSIKSNLIPVHEMSSKIGDLCIFKCPNCDSNDMKSWRNLRCHFKKKHNSKGLGFSANLVVTARYHSCLLCPMAVLSDRYFLGIHLRNKHSKSISTYEKTFQRNGGEVLPTMKEWLFNQNTKKDEP